MSAAYNNELHIDLDAFASSTLQYMYIHLPVLCLLHRNFHSHTKQPVSSARGGTLVSGFPIKWVLKRAHINLVPFLGTYAI